MQNRSTGAPSPTVPAHLTRIESPIGRIELTSDGTSITSLAIERDGVFLLVDPLSLQYLAGAEIDYSESLTGAQFVIRNPNAKTTCGCGSSFTV